MVITKSLNGTEETFKVEGRLDTLAAPALLDELEQMDDHVDSVVFDFSELEYISSMGLRALVIASKKVNGALVIKNVSPRIMSILSTTGLDNTIRIE
ncbi:anti-sigma B factor antagonist/stage II sporulation protein AA (anti-sigma F factor antagonist) [Oribacterium sp. KHPX15]|uniref:STAS domain-containing protein n=1 Tax=Oribacterium sp. KHPX15 TaxID=1855342 RepID=UPI000897A2C3|nr:STAS domain-containing protein [Oribacterium sp. KHPX15]SEA67654.1 anti-sigma B factor antagonist/stage II sporulation protein AA (anti-sigma F factor antagonist) [Oribacterium sp. KHPX15]